MIQASPIPEDFADQKRAQQMGFVERLPSTSGRLVVPKRRSFTQARFNAALKVLEVTWPTTTEKALAHVAFA
ncbi:hypothetical protein [Aquisalimonas sp.]|uniref:hypothetical protein n=1 Tax=Aquisalimonas sp. TaxID=1872621 RepID=UPI0025C67ACC|nr:hypothetical protein [Aquisalimonas sp.]